MTDEEAKKRVDEDWKAQAAREKQKLQESAAPSADETTEPAAPAEASFSALVAGLRAQALIGLGLVGDPVSGRSRPDREQAKYVIDTLGVLEQKTKGNLTEEETALLNTVLFELRTSFVRM